MSVKIEYKFNNSILKVVVTGKWTREIRPPGVAEEILAEAEKFLAKGVLLINHCKGKATKEEAQELGRLGGTLETLLAIANIPGEFPDIERVQNFTVAKVAGSAAKTPFVTFYDEKEALEWLKEAIKSAD